MKKKIEVIDCTPTWHGMLPLYLDAVMNGNIEAYQAAMEELRRMAKLADKYAEIIKSEETCES